MPFYQRGNHLAFFGCSIFLSTPLNQLQYTHSSSMSNVRTGFLFLFPIFEVTLCHPNITADIDMHFIWSFMYCLEIRRKCQMLHANLWFPSRLCKCVTVLFSYIILIWLSGVRFNPIFLGVGSKVHKNFDKWPKLNAIKYRSCVKTVFHF